MDTTTKTYQMEEALGEIHAFTATDDGVNPITANYVIWHSGTTEIGKGYIDLDAARRAMMNRTRYLGKKEIAASGATRSATVIA